MKGFLIFMVLVVGASVYFLANSADLCKSAVAAVDKDEGPNDQAFQDQVYADPAKFADVHRPFLQRRVTLAKVLTLLNEREMMIEMVRGVRARYEQSSLATDPDFGDLLYREAAGLEDEETASQGSESNEICKRYMVLFPDGKHVAEVSAMSQRLAYKYNFH